MPRPVLISGGLLSTDSKVIGVFGYDEDKETTSFGNIDIILPANLIVDFEYKQSAEFEDWKDASYWNAHLVWTPTSNLTLILAHVNAGGLRIDKQSGPRERCGVECAVCLLTFKTVSGKGDLKTPLPSVSPWGN